MHVEKSGEFFDKSTFEKIGGDIGKLVNVHGT